MRRIFNYILAGLGIVVAFCLAFTIIVVLIAKDGDGTNEIAARWMPYISIILVMSLPALAVWGIFRLMRNFFFKNITKNDFEREKERVGPEKE